MMKIIIPNTSGLNVVDKNFEPKYFTKNKLRFVSPYVYTYKLYTKKRWIGKKIADVLTSEFCAYDLGYITESIRKGYIKVNQEKVSCDYLLRSNDLIQHKLLLFEKPVICNKIIILYEDKNFICVYKSASMPTHPVGFYQYNSLLRILQNYISSSLRKGQPFSGGDTYKGDTYKEDISKGDISGEANPKDGQAEQNEGDVIKISFNFRKATFRDIPGVGSPSSPQEELKEDNEGDKEGDSKVDLGKRQIGGHPSDERTYVAENAKKRKQTKTLLDDNNCLNESGQNRKKVNTILKGDNANGDDYLVKQSDLNEGKGQNGVLNEGLLSLNEGGSVPAGSSGAAEEGNRQNEGRANEGEPNDGEPNDGEPNDGEPNEGEPNDGEPNEGEPNEGNSTQPPVPPIPESTQRRVKHLKCRNNERKDKQEKDESYIYTLHRLDKLTSGIVLFGKNKNFSTFFSQNISNNSIKKSYITRVEGDFRTLIRTLMAEKKVINDRDNKTLNELVEEYCSVGKDDSPLPFNDSNSFKYDIFLHRNRYCEEGPLSGEGDMETLAGIVREKRNYLRDDFDVEKFELGGAGGAEAGTEAGTEAGSVREADGRCADSNRVESNRGDTNCGHSNRDGEGDEPFRQHFVVDFGYMYCENKKLLKYVFTKYSQRNRQIAEEYCLKPSITRFMFLSYNPELKESLVLCQPITGRTHQIRAHLKSLSFPISNDAQYNDNFAKEYMEKSVYLHFHEGEKQPGEGGAPTSQDPNGTERSPCDELSSASTAKPNTDNPDKKNNLEKYTHFPLIPFLNTSFHWLYDEKIDLNDTYNEADLNSYFFKKISNITYHSSGIFLHSFRYTWENVFDVFTLLPKWCSLFHLPRGLLTFLLYGSLS